MARHATLVVLNRTLIDGSGHPPVPNEALWWKATASAAWDGCLRMFGCIYSACRGHFL